MPNTVPERAVPPTAPLELTWDDNSSGSQPGSTPATKFNPKDVFQVQYGLNWPGKRLAQRRARTPSQGYLQVCPQESLDYDTTGHTFIEGDNLEVLKLLQSEYSQRFRLIYIDPPYNTGHDLVYNDSFRAPLANASPKRQRRTPERCQSGDDTHSPYLNMMYPRLLLARNLLREDGIMLISIDDCEMANLRLIGEEIFGSDNFLGQLVWTTKNGARGNPPRTMLMSNHEYVLVFARNAGKARFQGLPRNEQDFANPDNDPRGPWRSESMKATGNRRCFFAITDPRTGRKYHANWAFSQATLQAMINDDLVIFPDTPSGTPRQKKFIDSYTNNTKATVTSLGWHSTEKATNELIRLFDGKKVFHFPKPQSLMQYLVQQTTGPDDLVLDFFAGSGSTGEAVWRVNTLDQGRRRFVLVQLPEPLTSSHPGRELGCDNIAALARERLRRVSKIIKQSASTPLDCGFRFYRLESSPGDNR